MNIAFGIYKYFPYSGLALDMLRIAKECVNRGHQVTIYTLDWQGKKPEDISVVIIKATAMSNHENAAIFNRRFMEYANEGEFELSIGFNKIPQVDYYFCGDFCYVEHSVNKHNFFYRWTARFKSFKAFEKAIFETKSKTKILSLSAKEDKVFKKLYSTQNDRFISLPPMLDKAKWIYNDKLPSRTEMRKILGVNAEQDLMLFVGSDFERKGLDRALIALSSLDEKLRNKVVFCIAGQSKVGKHQQLTEKLGISKHVQFLGPRGDVPALMKAADILIHPARAELAGGVIVEAIVSGLAVIVTGVCGYAWHVSAAQAGTVLDGEFNQKKLNQCLAHTLVSDKKKTWRQNGIKYSKNPNLYAMATVAVDEFERSQSGGALTAPDLPDQQVAFKLENWLSKTSKVVSNFNKVITWKQDESDELDGLLAQVLQKQYGKEYLDQLISESNFVLKDDKTTTVILTTIDNVDYIIKRYNARDHRHVVTRAVRKSRAKRCWDMSSAYAKAGLNIAKPNFIYEQRIGPFRIDAYLVSEVLLGEELLSILPTMNHEQQQSVVEEINVSFRKMHNASISHGDLKATNLMWVNGEVFFIDLDASRQHKIRSLFDVSHAKDKKRFLRNWQNQPELLALFDDLI